jgi:tetratricopeptide (TPR) repeat protein
LNPVLDTARKKYFDGNVGAAICTLQKLEVQSRNDHLLLQQIAELYLKCGQHVEAGRCYARSVELQPSNPDYLYNLAASKTALGDLEAAETLYTQVIHIRPDDHGAWLNRSGLRTQTPQKNHVDQLKYVKSRLKPDDSGQVQVCYALAKELEDIRNYDEAFRFLQEGSHQRRQAMQYDVREDEAAMAAIGRFFDEKLLSGIGPQHQIERPVFVLGLPRSGTTLIDRIISSHSQVSSLGEHNTLPLALMNMARVETGDAGGYAAEKIRLIEQSARLDFAELGRRYCSGIDGFDNPAVRLIDKTPLNFLYLGLIHLAMPGAKIIHMRRHPVDNCYAMYKTLFRAGYPFSYSLQEVGRYYIAYRGLMDHWRKTIPGAFLEVDYESVIAEQEGESRRILDYLGLEWEDACLEFHRHRGPAATASAAQVRQPIYSTSVGLWRNYARQLGPLAKKLHEHGIEFD